MPRSSLDIPNPARRLGGGTFAQPPDNGYCESVLFWHVRRGHYGDVPLDGLSFTRVGKWEGDLRAGRVKGAAGIFIDERADARQADALPMIFSGRAGGFPAQVAALFTAGRQVIGVERARNAPGSETGPGQVVTWGKSTACTVDAFGYKWAWTPANSSKHIPFDWSGP